MNLSKAQKAHFRNLATTSRECTEVASFLAAFVFPVSVPLSLFATVELSRVVRRLADDLPQRDDYESRTTLGIGRMSAVALPDEALGVAADFTPATTTERGGWSSPRLIRNTGRAAYFTAVAADEALYWLTAARRAEERAESVPEADTSQLRNVRGQEAYGYYSGAGGWLNACDLRSLGNWARLSVTRLERERERLLRAKIGNTPLRDLIQANLARHDIAPLRAAEVARVFKPKPAVTVVEEFDPAKAHDVLERADGELSALKQMLAQHLSELRLLSSSA